MKSSKFISGIDFKNIIKKEYIIIGSSIVLVFWIELKPVKFANSAAIIKNNKINVKGAF